MRKSQTIVTERAEQRPENNSKWLCGSSRADRQVNRTKQKVSKQSEITSDYSAILSKGQRRHNTEVDMDSDGHNTFVGRTSMSSRSDLMTSSSAVPGTPKVQTQRGQRIDRDP